MLKKILIGVVLIAALLSSKKQEIRIKLATTTSTENSGLLGYILPEFTKKTGIAVDVISVGTGKALALGENGDVDVVLVHARNLEDKFVESGFGVNRKDVMYNDFIVVGDKEFADSLKEIKDVAALFKVISEKEINFISRGDNSGTHVKEKEIWSKAGITPSGKWYKEVGQGMEQTLTITENMKGLTLTDRGTYLAVKDKLNLKIIYEKDDMLSNPYGVIAVNPKKWKHAKYKEAMKFVNWLTSPEGKKIINNFKINGEQLFFAN